MSTEILKLIILSCQLGASGMGGSYNKEQTILDHQKYMTESNLSIQKQCQKELIICVKRQNVKKETDKLVNCLTK